MNLWLSLLLAFVLAGCVRTVVPPPPPTVPVVPPPPVPHFQKTFGSIQPLANAGLAIQYKKISLLIDPDTASQEIDYVLLTGSDARRWPLATQNTLRKNTKILCSPADTAVVTKSGFTQSKGITPGQRVMLKKEDGFLFSSVTAGQSYFLEFDNGKNILVAGDIPTADSVRDFLYSLRDDGRDIEIGFFRISPNTDLAVLAQIIGLLQPKNVELLREPGAKNIDLTAFREQLKTEFFEGPIGIAGYDAMVF